MTGGQDNDDARRAKVRKLALVLGGVALAFYIGFIVISGMR